jgi:hypothetical protein
MRTGPSFALMLLLPLVHGAEVNTLTPEEKSAGWHLLFDGSSLAGWRGFKVLELSDGWAASAGAITRTGSSGDLVTMEEFGDFELSFEWKVGAGTNSGVLYRVGLGEAATYLTGPEYQILDNTKAEPDRHEPKRTAGAIYGLVAPRADLTKPPGEWNTARIVVRGWHIEHWMNGEKIAEVDLASPEGKSLIASSKFHSWPSFATRLHGHIALQDHTGDVAYRNIKIREIK